MKIIKIFALFLMGVNVACTTDETIKELPTEVVHLKFNKETAQDQMGDFAENAMTLFNDMVWSQGGTSYTVDNYTPEVWNSENGKNWASVVSINPKRHAHTLTTFNGKMWLIGGEDLDGNFLADIHYSTDGSTWVNLFLTAPFGAVAYHTTVVFNSKMYVIAGKRSTGNTEVWSTLDGENWTQETPNAFSGRGGHKAVVLNNAMYVIGGEDASRTRLNEIWTSANGSSWSQVATVEPLFSPRGGHTATLYKDKVWVIAGRDDTSLYLNDIWYSSDMIHWKKYEEVVPFEPIAAHTTLKYNDALWVFGGYKSGGLSGAIWSIKKEE